MLNEHLDARARAAANTRACLPGVLGIPAPARPGPSSHEAAAEPPSTPRGHSPARSAGSSPTAGAAPRRTRGPSPARSRLTTGPRPVTRREGGPAGPGSHLPGRRRSRPSRRSSAAARPRGASSEPGLCPPPAAPSSGLGYSPGHRDAGPRPRGLCRRLGPQSSDPPSPAALPGHRVGPAAQSH